MPPPSEDIRTLIRKLTKATTDKTVKWESVTASRFKLDRTNGRLMIECVDGDDNHPYRFRVYNPQGTDILSVETVVGERYRSWEVEVQGLYEAARRDALGVDSVLSGLEHDLGLDEVQDPADDDLLF